MIALTIMDRHYYGNTINEAKAKAFDDIINQDLVKIESDRYVVQPGDSLYSIAKKLYGVGELWPDIAKINRDSIPDARLIHPGIVLRLPKLVKI